MGASQGWLLAVLLLMGCQLLFHTLVVEHALPNDDTLSISDKKIALNVQHPVWFHIKGKVSCIRLETADIYKIVY
jgi:hypothetical protein